MIKKVVKFFFYIEENAKKAPNHIEYSYIIGLLFKIPRYEKLLVLNPSSGSMSFNCKQITFILYKNNHHTHYR